EPSAADAQLRVAVAGEHAGDKFHAGPDAARVLPAAAGAAEPLAENRAREHEAALGFKQRPGQRRGLAGGAHADADEVGEQIGGDRQARAFRDIVHVADQFQAASGADDAREQFGQILAGTFNAWGNDAAGDDGGFKQTEIVFGEIKNVGQVRDVGRSAEVNAGQAQEGFVDGAQVRFHGRFGGGVASVHGQVNRDIQHSGAFGIIHGQKEDVAPAAMG